MKRLNLLFQALALSILFFAVNRGMARDFVTLHSEHLGDGWFSYTIRMEPNPFFST